MPEEANEQLLTRAPKDTVNQITEKSLGNILKCACDPISERAGCIDLGEKTLLVKQIVRSSGAVRTLSLDGEGEAVGRNAPKLERELSRESRDIQRLRREKRFQLRYSLHP